MTKRLCRWCLAPINGSNDRKQFCDGDCRKRHWSRARYGNAEGYGAVLAGALRCCQCGTAIPPRPTVQGRNSLVICDECRLPPIKTCPNCSRSHRGAHPACSPVCSRQLRRRHFKKKSAVRRERVAQSPEHFTREEVFERDRFICGICGEPTSPAEAHPHPYAPVVDHVIPISAGGQHVWANVQCAHSRCNTVKGALIPDE